MPANSLSRILLSGLCLAALSACSRSGEISAASGDQVTIRLEQGTHRAAEAQAGAERLCADFGRKPQFLAMTTEPGSLARHIIRYDFACVAQGDPALS
ncbi:hypothetical protein XINFAN_02913 [Pseudogemmobacter humi]|uniref:Lipoprotein n=2 Tax=Pseudogemmobacter humi TaxID=2483812 RepID=A0A3P5XRK8_9RHOB|nr:hypothetical protein XINFAN_02913 [Pseudogemmobacter humi]